MSYTDFSFFVKLGWGHIISLGAMDHLLFILSLCKLSNSLGIRRWIHITLSFAIGHTISMTTGRYFNYPISMIEFFIPLTIIGSSIWTWKEKNESDFSIYYFSLILIFGFIHGLGFSSAFEMLSPSGSDSISSSLGFTTGLELSQIAVLFTFILISKMLEKVKVITKQTWNLSSSLIPLIGGIYMSISRWPF